MMLASYHEFLAAYRGSGTRPDLVISSTLGLAAAFAAESEGIPNLRVHMQPAIFRSLEDCPVFAHGLGWLPAAPAAIKHMAFNTIDGILNFNMRRPINALRSELSLAPIRDVYREVVLGGDGVALMTPAWFAKPQPEWPEGVHQFAFPLDRSAQILPAALQTFLGENPKPVLWTHGSANFDTRSFHRCAISASRNLDMPFLIVGPEPPEDPLPFNGLAISHVPFDVLFPMCRAVVHHGGIGTTAKAIAAGLPQLVVPRAHDQPDNAARLARLKLGRNLPYPGLSPARATRELEKLLTSPAIQEGCIRTAPLVRDADDSMSFADFAESFVLHPRPL
jgi:UDP:flavonoid glycosyltransferase YjiC (YdhE family)